MGKVIIFVISDSVGETVELVAKAASSQFQEGTVEIRRIPHVKNMDHIRDVFKYATESNGIVLYTLVTEELRLFTSQLAFELNVRAIDILGEPIREISRMSGNTPITEVGRIRKLDENYFRRVAAMEFAVRYDDGKDPRGFKLADVVVLGVSRASKTPVCMYLAHKNIKAANLPIVPEIKPPDILFEIPPKKIFGLKIKPQTLNEIRQQRLKSLGLTASADYANPNRLIEELEYADALYRKLGCHVLDVTNKAIEETASNIIEIFDREVNNDY